MNRGSGPAWNLGRDEPRRMRRPSPRRVRTLFQTFAALLFAFCGLGSSLAGGGADLKTVSPKKTFTVIQHYGKNWRQTFQPTDRKRPPVTLEEDILWPAEYQISPDERWILRIQKSGSGENVSYLYQVDPDGRLRRREPPIGELAFGYLKKAHGIDAADLYHTGIDFLGWDLKAGELHFSIHGTPTEKSGEKVNLSLSYDLRNHRIRKR